MLKRFKRVKARIGRIVLPNSPSSSLVPFLEYINWFRYTRWTSKLPYSIDIQTQSGCNAHCSFCPVGKEENKIKGKMSDELFKKIVDEVITFPGLRKINPFLLNDPLVDNKLPEKIAYIAQKRGQNKIPKIRIVTNAGLLTDEMGYRLLRANALDEMTISFHSIIPHVYEKMMSPLKFDRVMSNIIRFKEQWDRHSGKKPKLVIWTVRTKSVIENLTNEKAYWKKLGFDFNARKLDNRANANIEAVGLRDQEFMRVSMCVIPFRRAWVMWNGDMIMCCVDQERSNLLGNCTSRSIREIWNDPEYQGLRHRWRTKQLDGLLCQMCKGT